MSPDACPDAYPDASRALSPATEAIMMATGERFQALLQFLIGALPDSPETTRACQTLEQAWDQAIQALLVSDRTRNEEEASCE